MASTIRGTASILGIVSTLLLIQVASSQERPCANAEGRRALEESVTLRSWDALFKSYKSYRQCDDGAVAEGYSESVARILADHWNTLPRLANLAEKDAAFQEFVLKHVDVTVNKDDVERIKKNADTKCPTGLRRICHDLAGQADSALKENSSP
jgi:hypothetical protein